MKLISQTRFLGKKPTYNEIVDKKTNQRNFDAFSIKIVNSDQQGQKHKRNIKCKRIVPFLYS